MLYMAFVAVANSKENYMDTRCSCGNWHLGRDEDVHVCDDAVDNGIRWKNSNNGITEFQ